MIKINILLESWKRSEYDQEAIKNEYKRLYNAIQALYENSLITSDTRNKEYTKLEKAYHKAIGDKINF